MDKAVAEIRRMAVADMFDGILWKQRTEGLQSVTVVKFAGACGPDAIRSCLASICVILHPSIEPNMPHSPAEKKKAINRLRRIRGQAEALEQRIADGSSCGEVLQQLAAIRGGVNGLMGEVLEGHLRETFGVADDAADDLDETGRRLHAAIDEAAALVRSYLK